MSAKDLSDFLKNHVNELNLSVKAITKKAGISRQTWHRIITNQAKQIRIDTLERIAFALRVSLIDLSMLYVKKQHLCSKALKSYYELSDHYPFLTEKSIFPKDILVNREEVFKKEWIITNVGNSYWSKKKLICVDELFDIFVQEHRRFYSDTNPYNLIPEQNSIEIPPLAPKQQITLSVYFRAPIKPRTVISYWRIVNSENKPSFPDEIGLLSCKVKAIENSVSRVNPTFNKKREVL